MSKMVKKEYLAESRKKYTNAAQEEKEMMLDEITDIVSIVDFKWG